MSDLPFFSHELARPRRHFFRRKLGRYISAWLLAFSMPMLAVTTAWIVGYGTRELEDTVIERGRVSATAGAIAYGLMLERGVDAGKITMTDIAHPTYMPFEFEHPTDIPRFHSGIDAYTDAAGARSLQEGILRTSEDFLYALGSDGGTYIPTTNAKFDHPPTGDPKIDNSYSRQKRKYLDKLHLAAAAAETLLVQAYYRDTGELCWDVSAPVWVHGVHWGSFRVGVSRDRIEAYQWRLALRLSGILAGLGLALAVMVLWMVGSSTRELEILAKLADDVSMGESLRVPIRSMSVNEIGRIARAIDRMRVSLMHAMRRLDHRETGGGTVVEPRP